CKTIDRLTRNSPLEIDRYQIVHTPVLTLALANHTVLNPKILHRRLISLLGTISQIPDLVLKGGFEI
ncbi:hypothetical protein, partial [Burkholderia gladioli]|uniref:hypothetical protein n=1 Tax=Burkholderia gladioli TaxID=28095 RepID=UPI001ABB7AFD